MTEADVVIIGTGPAGVSAAFPLLDAGLRVMLIDGGRQPILPKSDDNYVTLRQEDPEQWRLFVGKDFHALRSRPVNSPKFRAPTMAPVFEGYEQVIQPILDNFTLIGSLASGGLSNAWGAGVAIFDEDDLRGYPIALADLAPSYRIVATRIGISGTSGGDLTAFFGADLASQPPVALDPNADALLDRHRRRMADSQEIRLDRVPSAVLTQPLHGRSACDRSALCLWGCSRRAIYSAAFDLDRLRSHPNCRYLAMTVTSLVRDGEGYRIDGVGGMSLRAKRIVLACGAIGTARLVLGMLGHRDKPVQLLSTPGAGFALLLPHMLGRTVQPKAFGLAQLAFTLPLPERDLAFGALFGTAGIPMYEFVNRAPLARRSAQAIFRMLLPAMLVGNCFLPGEFTAHRLSLDRQGQIAISGRYAEGTVQLFKAISRRLRRFFRMRGAIMLPGSFSLAEPGADAHYAGTVPMKSDPMPHECDRNGEVAGAPGVCVADGAALTRLPSKAHTLTIMANADRIGRKLASRLTAGNV